MIIECGRFNLDLSIPKIMGIVNITPDSFSDGGTYSQSVYSTLQHAECLVNDGADILDIGGESSRPNAPFVSEKEEWARVKDVLLALRDWNIPISLDTRRSYVMQQAIDMGIVDMINDIEALQAQGGVEILSQQTSIAIVLMHMQGQPENMQDNPSYRHVIQEVTSFLQKRILYCEQHGIKAGRLIIDPGIGFGKTLEHNLRLLGELNYLVEKIQRPLLIGVSRKSMFGEITKETDPRQRIGSSIVAEIEAVRRGASIIRTHNVKQAHQALLTYLAINAYARN